MEPHRAMDAKDFSAVVSEKATPIHAGFRATASWIKTNEISADIVD